jgi:hypothetical protein
MAARTIMHHKPLSKDYTPAQKMIDVLRLRAEVDTTEVPKDPSVLPGIDDLKKAYLSLHAADLSVSDARELCSKFVIFFRRN